jgi:hypothetical protein
MRRLARAEHAPCNARERGIPASPGTAPLCAERRRRQFLGGKSAGRSRRQRAPAGSSRRAGSVECALIQGRLADTRSRAVARSTGGRGIPPGRVIAGGREGANCAVVGELRAKSARRRSGSVRRGHLMRRCAWPMEQGGDLAGVEVLHAQGGSLQGWRSDRVRTRSDSGAVALALTGRCRSAGWGGR